MNNILDSNKAAIASVSALFVIIFGFSDSDAIIDAADKAAVKAVNEWYEKQGRTFDIENEEVEPDALKYAAAILVKIKNMAEAAVSLSNVRK